MKIARHSDAVANPALILIGRREFGKEPTAKVSDELQIVGSISKCSDPEGPEDRRERFFVAGVGQGVDGILCGRCCSRPAHVVCCPQFDSRFGVEGVPYV